MPCLSLISHIGVRKSGARLRGAPRFGLGFEFGHTTGYKTFAVILANISSLQMRWATGTATYCPPAGEPIAAVALRCVQLCAHFLELLICLDGLQSGEGFFFWLRCNSAGLTSVYLRILCQPWIVLVYSLGGYRGASPRIYSPFMFQRFLLLCRAVSHSLFAGEPESKQETN